MTRQPSWVLFGAAALLGFAAAWLVSVPLALARPSGQPAIQAEEDAQICPLSDQQFEHSKQTFAAMMPTFTHPRCLNCHGAVNPFAANTTHVGGRIGTKFIKIVRHDDILDRDIELVMPDLEDPDALFRSCQDCHSAFPGWQLPRPAKWFVGKDSSQLCRQMKTEFPGIAAFVDHLEHDVGLPFIAEAFRGTRGLDTYGQATYENETGQDFKPEPPPISNAAFVAQGRAWVEAMGVHDANTVKGGPTCGCLPHHYVLQTKADIVFGEDKPYMGGQFDLKIPIAFSEDASFSGETQIDLPLTGDYAGVECNYDWPIKGSTWTVNGKVEDNGELKLALTIHIPATDLTAACPASTVVSEGRDLEQSIDFAGSVAVGDAFHLESGPFKIEFVIVEQGS